MLIWSWSKCRCLMLLNANLWFLWHHSHKQLWVTASIALAWCCLAFYMFTVHLNMCTLQQFSFYHESIWTNHKNIFCSWFLFCTLAPKLHESLFLLFPICNKTWCLCVHFFALWHEYSHLLCLNGYISQMCFNLVCSTLYGSSWLFSPWACIHF